MNQTDLSIFHVTEERGFFPMQDPLCTLPAEYIELETFMQELPKVKKNGVVGYLSSEEELEKAVASRLPFYKLEDINDSRLLAALFRDYSFLASAWLLQPCDFNNLEGKGYGTGRSFLPANIAQPLLLLSRKLEIRPFLDYACSYILNNWMLIDQEKPFLYENIQPIRMFYGSKSESAFIRVHAAVNNHGKDIVKLIKTALEAVKSNDRRVFNESLTQLCKVNQEINVELRHMMVDNTVTGFNQFRTYLLGTKDNSSFPEGVIYTGSTTEIRTKIRGSSGAMDSIIPALDNFLQITELYLPNPLTNLLKKLRTYKPKEHIRFLESIEAQAICLGVREYACMDTESATLYYLCIELMRQFKGVHKCFIHVYLGSEMKGTSGSSIASWIQNQYETVEKLLNEMSKKIDQIRLAEVVKALDISWQKPSYCKASSVRMLKEKCPIKRFEMKNCQDLLSRRV